MSLHDLSVFLMDHASQLRREAEGVVGGERNRLIADADQCARWVNELQTTDLAQEHALPELQWLAEETKRRFNGRRAPIRSRHVDDDLRIRIQAYAAANPKASQQAIAEHFSTNAGRVSEALFGKRGEE